MGVQIAKHGKAPKRSRHTTWGDPIRLTIKNMNVEPCGGWNRTREEARRVRQRQRNTMNLYAKVNNVMARIRAILER